MFALIGYGFRASEIVQRVLFFSSQCPSYPPRQTRSTASDAALRFQGSPRAWLGVVAAAGCRGARRC